MSILSPARAQGAPHRWLGRRVLGVEQAAVSDDRCPPTPEWDSGGLAQDSCIPVTPLDIRTALQTFVSGMVRARLVLVVWGSCPSPNPGGC